MSMIYVFLLLMIPLKSSFFRWTSLPWKTVPDPDSGIAVTDKVFEWRNHFVVTYFMPVLFMFRYQNLILQIIILCENFPYHTNVKKYRHNV